VINLLIITLSATAHVFPFLWRSVAYCAVEH